MESLANRQMVNIGEPAPVRKTFFVAGNPLDRLLLKQPVILSRRFFYDAEVNDGLMPGLSQNGNGEVPL